MKHFTMTALLIIAIVFVASISQAGDREDEIERRKNKVKNDVVSRCIEKWGNDYEMREYCQNNQRKAFMTFYGDYYNYHDVRGTDKNSIMLQCVAKWSDRKQRIDWEMSLHCTERQFAAYERLNN